jgi:hypothetical protein
MGDGEGVDFFELPDVGETEDGGPFVPGGVVDGVFSWVGVKLSEDWDEWEVDSRVIEYPEEARELECRHLGESDGVCIRTTLSFA